MPAPLFGDRARGAGPAALLVAKLHKLSMTAGRTEELVGHQPWSRRVLR